MNEGEDENSSVVVYRSFVLESYKLLWPCRWFREVIIYKFPIMLRPIEVLEQKQKLFHCFPPIGCRNICRKFNNWYFAIIWRKTFCRKANNCFYSSFFLQNLAYIFRIIQCKFIPTLEVIPWEAAKNIKKLFFYRILEKGISNKPFLSKTFLVSIFTCNIFKLNYKLPAHKSLELIQLDATEKVKTNHVYTEMSKNRCQTLISRQHLKTFLPNVVCILCILQVKIKPNLEPIPR